MKKYHVSLSLELTNSYNVEAKTEEEAIKKAIELFEKQKKDYIIDDVFEIVDNNK